jgi:hypothetical protein
MLIVRRRTAVQPYAHEIPFAQLVVFPDTTVSTHGRRLRDHAGLPQIPPPLRLEAQLPIVVREPAPLPRPSRRQREREDRTVPDVSVVRLRRLERAGPAPSAEAAEWSCQWLVQGHWRRQWDPSVGEHPPMYIDPHLKGDFEKPFRQPRQKLYVVAR